MMPAIAWAFLIPIRQWPPGSIRTASTATSEMAASSAERAPHRRAIALLTPHRLTAAICLRTAARLHRRIRRRDPTPHRLEVPRLPAHLAEASLAHVRAPREDIPDFPVGMEAAATDRYFGEDRTRITWSATLASSFSATAILADKCRSCVRKLLARSSFCLLRAQKDR